MLVDLCRIFQAGAVGTGPGPEFGRKPTQNRPNLKSGQTAFLSGSLKGGELRIPNCHEMALELGCGAEFWCNRHCRTSPVVLEGFWGQVWPKIRRKPEKKEFRIANEPLSFRYPALKAAMTAADVSVRHDVEADVRGSEAEAAAHAQRARKKTLRRQGHDLLPAVLRAKIKIKNPRIRAGIGPKPTISLGK